MKKINPKDYDFIFRVDNITYLETTYIAQEYLKQGFVFVKKGSEWKVYLHKRDRKRLGRYGLLFLKNRLTVFKKEVIKKCNIVKRSFLRVKEKKLSTMGNFELRKDFLEIVKFIQSLWQLYFYTEYFLYDRAAEMMAKNLKNKNHLSAKVNELGKIKFKMRRLINETIFRGNILEKYLQEIKKRTKRKDIHFLHFQEVADLLVEKKVEKVNRNNFVLGKFNNLKPIVRNKALKIIKLLEAIERTDVEDGKFRGQVANSGIYYGRVKIIPFDVRKDITNDIRKMKKGNVLVTGSTGPEMILACKKAGAIITEEGGICSHAAVVSRELKIPCIIGTKIATKVLKDGDLVEVDADKGIVRILEKK